jgi:nucleotidyltransferase/DNA polymerase involved in DNA repair
MIRCIFHVDFDIFFVSAEQTLDVNLEGKSVIFGVDPERCGVASSASYEARAFGFLLRNYANGVVDREAILHV